MRRYAMVVVVEAEGPEQAMQLVRDDLVAGAEDSACVYVGDACTMGPVDEYETEQIKLRADGYVAYTAPPDPLPEAGDMSRADGLGGDPEGRA